MSLTVRPLVTLVMLAIAAPASAQVNTPARTVDSAMTPLAWLVGEWRGQGTMQTPAGRQIADVHERVESRLEGRVLVIEGIGRDASSGQVAHHAFGVLSYDPDARRYAMRAFREGRFVDADTELNDGVFTWGFAVPGGRVRYHLRQEEGNWVETGEFSPDGATWRQFFEMRLNRASADR